MPELAEEPAVRRSVAAGCALVCFSGDKLFGGPQAGVMVGTAAAIELCRTHPLARALRIDRLSLAALEATARVHLDPERAVAQLPVLRMLRAERSELQRRASEIWLTLRDAGVDASVVQASGRVGGGALPLLELEGPVCAVEPGELGADELARRLRTGGPAVIARVRDGMVLLDPRTLDDGEARLAAEAVRGARRLG